MIYVQIERLKQTNSIVPHDVNLDQVINQYHQVASFIGYKAEITDDFLCQICCLQIKIKQT